MTWECKPEFPLLLLLLSHLIQAGTWTKVSSSIKMQRHYKGRKSAACMHSLDNYEQQDTKWSSPSSHYWGVGGKSKVVSVSRHTAPPKGWADHVSHALCLTHGSTPPSPHIRDQLVPLGIEQGNLFPFPPTVARIPMKQSGTLRSLPHHVLSLPFVLEKL